MLRTHSEAALQEAIEVLTSRLPKNLSVQDRRDIRHLLQTWRGALIRRYKKRGVNGNLKRFLVREAEWLNAEVPIPQKFLRPSPNGNSTSSKRRRAIHVSRMQQEDPEILLLGTARTIAKVGTPRSMAKSKLLKDMAKRKNRAMEILSSASKRQHCTRDLTAEEALKLHLELNLTRAQYVTLRGVTKMAGHTNLFPSYQRVLEAKAACRPSPSTIQATESGAQVSLASLLDHTVHRVIQLRREVILEDLTKSNTNVKEATFLLSWGMDGSGNQSKYKQRGEKDGYVDESHLFVVSIVPLRLFSDTLYWINPTPQSPLFCRPLKIVFQKEDKNLVLRERDQVLAEIQRLDPLRLKIGDNFTFV